MVRVMTSSFRVTMAVLMALLSVPLVTAAGSQRSEPEKAERFADGDITPFGINPTETVRVCLAGLPAVREDRPLRWNVRFIEANGDQVAGERLEVPYPGFKCIDMSYEDVIARTAAGAAIGQSGRVQLAVHASLDAAGARTIGLLNGDSREIANVGTVEIVAASGQTTVVVGRFGMKTLDVSRPPRP